MIRIEITDQYRTLIGGIADSKASWDMIMEHWGGSRMKQDIFGLDCSDKIFRHFCVLHQRFQPMRDCRVRIAHDMMPALQLSLTTYGDFNLQLENGKFAGQGLFSLDRHDMIESSTIILKEGRPTATLDINITNDLLEEFFCHHPQLLEAVRQHHETDKSLIMYADSKMMRQKALRRLTADIAQSSVLGSAAELYLENKIVEIVAFFLSVPEEEANPRSFLIRSKMHDVREIILSRYKEMPSLYELARMVGTNECTLKQAFKEEFGTTVFQYVFDYLMQLATSYLLDTTLPIADIAMRVGYEYQSHFCTAFKKKYGITPMEYRLQRGENCLHETTELSLS